MRASGIGRMTLGPLKRDPKTNRNKTPTHSLFIRETFQFMVWQIEKLRDAKFIFEPVDKQILKYVNVSEQTMSVLRFFCSYPRPAIGVQIDEKFKKK